MFRWPFFLKIALTAAIFFALITLFTKDFPDIQTSNHTIPFVFKEAPKFLKAFHQSSNESLGHLEGWQSRLYSMSRAPLASGVIPEGRKWLVIGISTVFRKEEYLRTTLVQMLKESSPHERQFTIIVIYLADADPEKRSAQLGLILKHFRAELDSGFIQIIQSDPDIYPPMTFAKTKRTFGDPEDRVIWRTKQVIDFAFIFSYVAQQNFGDHFMVLEDDIIPCPHYLTAIREFTESRNRQNWTALRFTDFLGIGLLFHTYDLPKLVQFVLLFHQVRPIDMLMGEFINLEVPDSKLISRRIPSTFQHIGTKSTLKNKVQKIKDWTFGTANRQFNGHNPPATLRTSMQVYNEFFPEYAYKKAPGFFWGIPKNEETFDIILKEPKPLSRLGIVSGIWEKKTVGKKVVNSLKDLIVNGEVKVSANRNCQGLVKVGQFEPKKEVLDITFDPISDPVGCVRILLGKHTTWIIIREIAIFVAS